MSKIIEDVIEKIQLKDKIATLEARLAVLQRSSIRDQSALWGRFFKQEPINNSPVVKK
jgi:hypothetical protein